VVDYTRQDFTRSWQHYDLILDAIGNRSFPDMKRVLNPDGIVVMAGGSAGRWMIAALARTVRARVRSQFGSRKFVGMLARIDNDDLATLHELMRVGKIEPVIDRRYTLSEVPDAIRYLEEGHARGKVVITCG
jgi:NADPH:quinone reductase-like Zn-dependent oxidoreductase